MNFSISRRDLIRWCVTSTAVMPMVARMDVVRGHESRIRPYSWTDASQRSEVQGVSLSPGGDAYAVQVTRPLLAPGVHAGWARQAIQPRGEIWLLDRQLDSPRRLTVRDQWLWSPQFSPSGKKLAALTCTSDGLVGMVVWDFSENTIREFPGMNLDVYVRFAYGALAQTAIPAISPPWNKFAWIGDHSIVYVDHGESPPQFEQAIVDAPLTYSQLRSRTRDGELSVRVWKREGPTCGQGRRLARISSGSGKIEVLHRGDVRGVSISPDGRWIAAIMATRHIPIPSDQRMDSALRSTSIGDDPLVSLALARIDVAGNAGTRYVDGFDGVGNVAPARLPIWSPDSQRFAIPARGIYSSAYATGSDACWEVRVDTLEAERWPALSALDGELLAALIVSMPETKKQLAIKNRPSVTENSGKHKIGGGEIAGGVWPYGNRYVALWNSSTITLIGPEGVCEIPGIYRFAYAPVSEGQKAWMIAVDSDGVTREIAVAGIESEVRPGISESNWTYLGTRGSDGSLLAKMDSLSGTDIAMFSPQQRKTVSTLKLNHHFNGIEQPVKREILIPNKEGKLLKGVLQLPVGLPQIDRHPVIIWAYPDQQPSINGSMTQINHPYAVIFPIQYLLTRGFAVFHAPLSTRLEHLGGPLKLVTDAVIPWLDILADQPDIIPGEFGFYGHSNAGYVALALEVVTTRFKCVVASSTFPDLSVSPLSSSMDEAALDCAGQVIEADRRYYEDETQPYSFGAPFWRQVQNYIVNSPLYRMGSAKTPLLLLEGEFDHSPREMEAVYTILSGHGVPVELAYYWGEGHVINSPGNLRDVWQRTESFFGKYMLRKSKVS